MLDFLDWDYSFKSLKVKTETKTTIFKVSMSTALPRLRFSMTKTETQSDGYFPNSLFVPTAAWAIYLTEINLIGRIK